MRARNVLAVWIPTVAPANAVVVVAASIIDFRCANVQRETDVPLKIPSFLPYVCASMLFPTVKRTLDTGAGLRVPENGRKANEAAAQTCSQKRMEKRYQIINAKVLFCEAPANGEIDERLLPHRRWRNDSPKAQKVFSIPPSEKVNQV